MLSFVCEGVVFKDSMCFLPFPLAEFPKTFGLDEDRFEKVFFPHFFNTAENAGYEGKILSRDYFDPDGMSEKKKEKFEKWHANQVREKVRYVLRDELVKYFQSDVRLLAEGCNVFRQRF